MDIKVGFVSILGGFVALLAAGPAHAATVVSTTATTSGGSLTLRVSAADGKRNSVTVARSGASIMVTDSGDAVYAGAGCSAVDTHRASCSAAGVGLVSVATGDLADGVTKSASTPATIDGGEGDDVVIAGPAVGDRGFNELRGGGGNDTLAGGPDRDVLVGGTGGDRLGGGGGVDRADYGDHTTTVTVTIDGSAGDGASGEADNVGVDVEDVTGGQASDTLIGNGAANRLSGGAGADTLIGLGEDDTLVGGSGSDTLYGHDGSDRFLADATLDGADVFIAGGTSSAEGYPAPHDGHHDHVSYAARTAPVNADIDDGFDDGAAGEGDQLRRGIEHVTGGSASDTLRGTADVIHDDGSGTRTANRLSGGPGADTLNGLEGADTLVGGPGDDVLYGGNGSDTFLADAGADGHDAFHGGGPNDDPRYFDARGDRVSYEARPTPVTADIDGIADDGAGGEQDDVGSDVEELEGGSGNDTLTGGERSGGVVDGGPGDDTVNGVGGINTLLGGSGRDVLNGGDGYDRLDGGPGNDTLNGGASSDSADYSARSAAVVVTIDGVADDGEPGEGDNVALDVEVVSGGSGADRLTGNHGPNALSGGPGNDTLTGLGGSDRVIGGPGNDTLSGGDGTDHIDAFDSYTFRDTVDGEAGTDVCKWNDPHTTVPWGDLVTGCEHRAPLTWVPGDPYP